MTRTACLACGAATDAYLDWTCWRTLDTALTALPGLVNALVDAATRQTRVYRATARPRAADEDWRGTAHALSPHPIPVDLDAAALVHRAGNTLGTWARHLAEARGAVLPSRLDPLEGPACPGHQHDYTPGGCGLSTDDDGDFDCRVLHCDHTTCNTIRRGQLTGQAAALVRWMLEHRDAIRHDEAADVMLADVVALHGDLERAVDRSPSRLYAGPCHRQATEAVSELRNGTIYVQTVTGRCERHLYAWPGAAEIRCDGHSPDGRRLFGEGCGATHTWAERKYWLEATLDGELVTLAVALPAIGSMFPGVTVPPRHAVQAWVRQGRLVAHGLTSEGEPTFVGGELLELVKAYRPHRYAPRQRRTA